MMYMIALVIIGLLLVLAFGFMIFTRKGNDQSVDPKLEKKLQERERELEFLNKAMNIFAASEHDRDHIPRNMLISPYIHKYKPLLEKLEISCNLQDRGHKGFQF